jgi:hypothetical protein
MPITCGGELVSEERRHGARIDVSRAVTSRPDPFIHDLMSGCLSYEAVANSMTQSEGDPSRPTRRGAPRGLYIVLAVGLGGAAIGYAILDGGGGPDRRAGTGRGAPAQAPTPAGPAELALVAPLQPGGELDGWTITAIDVAQPGSISVHATREDEQVDLTVALVGPSSPTAPATAGAYGVYYASRSAEGGPRVSRDAPALATALAHVIEQNASVPTPPGMVGHFFGRPEASAPPTSSAPPPTSAPAPTSAPPPTSAPAPTSAPPPTSAP